MKANNNKILIILGSVLLVILTLTYFYWFNSSSKTETLPKPNIEIQTKIVKGVSIKLRNAYYTKSEIKIGYEIKGISIINDYNIFCKLYNNGTLLTTSDSTGGGKVELGKEHYYFTGVERISNRILPSNLNLTIEITAIPSNQRLENITASFEININEK